MVSSMRSKPGVKAVCCWLLIVGKTGGLLVVVLVTFGVFFYLVQKNSQNLFGFGAYGGHQRKQYYIYIYGDLSGSFIDQQEIQSTS